MIPRVALLGLSLVWGGLWSTQASAECSKTLTILQSDWRPYLYRQPDGRLSGLDFELITSILDLAGCRYEFIEQPFKRALASLEAGEIDLMTGVSVTPDRQIYGRFSHPYREERIVMMMRQRDLARFSSTSLWDMVYGHNLTVGTMMGGYYGETFGRLDQDALASENRLVYVESNARLLNMLVLGRIDVIVEDLASLHMNADRLGFDDRVAVHPRPLNSDVVHFILSRQSTTEADVDTINAAIDAFLASDSYHQLLSRYGLDAAGMLPYANGDASPPH